jgi:hypothetical protein
MNLHTIKIKITDEEKRALKKIAKIENISVRKMIKKYLFEKLEDEYEQKIAEKAYQEHLKDPIRYTFEDTFEILEKE